MIVLEKYFCGNEQNSEWKLKSMRQHLNCYRDEHDHITPEDWLFGVVVNVDGGVAVQWQTRNTRRGFAFLESPDSGCWMFEYNIGFLQVLFYDNCRRWRDGNVIIELQWMSVIARSDSRIFEQSEQEMVTVNSWIGAVVAGIMINLFFHVCFISSTDTFV